jgi:methionine-rich copper-binding protein CopC
MKPWILVAAMAGVLFSNVAGAHAHLHVSVPANHSTVSEAPKQISLQFNEPVQLTSVTIQKGDGSATKLGPLPDAAAKDFTLAVPALEAGNYIVKWRVVSDDGHIMADKLLFSVAAASK